LRRLLLRYQTAFLTQVMQSVACNGLHNVQERCCRWLLRCLDRSETADVLITHEFLAQMLGVRRASISEVLRPLHAEGLIRSGRGLVSVLDRKGLEGAACECYQIISLEFDRLMRGLN
jgi:CRP-like cAMP-binding protein